MSDEDRTLDVIVAFGVGILAGAATALLLAPASGEENRRRLGESAREMGDKIRERSREASDAVREQTRDAGEAFREQKENVLTEVRSQADRVGTAIDEGKQAYKRGTKNV